MFPVQSGPSGGYCMYPILTPEVLQKAFPAWLLHNQCMTVIGLCVFDMSCGFVIN
jgi:hypothetical protein